MDVEDVVRALGLLDHEAERWELVVMLAPVVWRFHVVEVGLVGVESLGCEAESLENGVECVWQCGVFRSDESCNGRFILNARKEGLAAKRYSQHLLLV